MKHHRLAVFTLVILACGFSSTAYSGNLLMMIGALSLEKQQRAIVPLSGSSIKAFKKTAPIEGPKKCGGKQ